MPVRVLIVHNSAVVQGRIAAWLSDGGGVEIVDCAADAFDARAKIKALCPDVVVLDADLPRLDGLSFLEKIMTLRPTPVVMTVEAGANHDAVAAHAMRLGAVGCFAYRAGGAFGSADDLAPLSALIRRAARLPAVPKGASRQRDSGAAHELIAIGSSTGGVEALARLLTEFPPSCPPTVIVQHVKARFASDIVQSLDSICAAKVVLAQTDTVLKPGHVYLAPGNDRHLRISNSTNGIISLLRPGAPVSGHQPSVDVLFASVAQSLGARAVGVLLTGMGQDGANGMLQMAQAGAWTIAQDEKSCVVFGMPRAAIAIGAACAVLPLNEITGHIFEREGALT